MKKIKELEFGDKIYQFPLFAQAITNPSKYHINEYMVKEVNFDDDGNLLIKIENPKMISTVKISKREYNKCYVINSSCGYSTNKDSIMDVLNRQMKDYFQEIRETINNISDNL